MLRSAKGPILRVQKTSLVRLPSLPRTAHSPSKVKSVSQRFLRKFHPGSQSVSRFTAAAKGLLETASTEALRGVSQLSARPSGLLLRMKKLEKSGAVQSQMQKMQLRVQELQKDYNALLAMRRTKEGLLAKLQDEANGLTLAAQADSEALETYRELKQKYAQMQRDLEAEEYTSRSLEAMRYDRTRALAESEVPLAQLRAELQKTETLHSGAECNLQRWTRRLKDARERKEQLRSISEVQQSERQKLKSEEFDNAKKRREFELCAELYHEKSNTAQRMQRNEVILNKLEQNQKEVVTLEDVAAELSQHQAYIVRQEGHLSKLRRVFPMENAEEAERYLTYLQHTEETLQSLSQQLNDDISSARDHLRRLNLELDDARREERPDPLSRFDMEQLLRSKEIQLDILTTNTEVAETKIAQACEIITKLLRFTTNRPITVSAVEPNELMNALNRFKAQVETYL